MSIHKNCIKSAKAQNEMKFELNNKKNKKNLAGFGPQVVQVC